jgi:putative ABC transport system permease protein
MGLSRLHRLLARLKAIVRAGDLDRDFTEELQSHLDLLTDEHVRRGMTPDAARRAALIRLGAPASLRAQHRDTRGFRGFEAVGQDLRFAFRLLAKDRWYSAAAIAALALGIGANAAGFTIVNAAFLRGLPYPDSDRLYVISWRNLSGRRSNATYSDLQDWRAVSRSFSSLAAYRNSAINISGDRAMPEEVIGTSLTANSFGVLGVHPILGRDFTLSDERLGADPVVLIGYELWTRRYGGDAGVLGETLRVNGQPATIVGVMPEGLRFPEDSDLWTPLVPGDAANQRNARAVRIFGRLSDGANRRQAQTEMNGIADQLLAADPARTKELVGAQVETFSDRFIGGAGRDMFLTVMGAVVLVLLIACANVANLLLSRSTARAREIAVRMAIGATRWRVIRQLLLESLLLSAIGGAIGLLLATAAVRMFGIAMEQGGFPYWVVFDVDRVVFAYVAAICVVTACLFGLAPAWYVSGTSGGGVLKEGARGITRGPHVRRFGSVLVLAELTLTTVLLVGAGLMIRSFTTLYSVDLGFRADRLMTMGLRLPDTNYKTPDARREFVDRLEARLAAIPGIDRAAATTGVPPNDGGERLLETDRSERIPGWRPVHVGTVAVTPRFFDVLDVRVIRGRNFRAVDGMPGTETVIINERLRTQFFPDEDPVGRRLRFVENRASDGTKDVWRTIVGVVPTIKHGSPQDGYENAVVYIPYRQETPAAVSLLVSSSLPPESLMDRIRREVQAIDPDQPVWSIQTLSQVLAETRWWWRVWSSIFAVFAGVAIALAGVGLYAVIAYSVAQRTQEIGVRMALGAPRRAVGWMILRRAVAQLVIGLTLGLGGAALLSDRLWGGGMIVIPPWDSTTYAAAAALLAVVSVAASLAPARRAMRVDPVTALRAE